MVFQRRILHFQFQKKKIIHYLSNFLSDYFLIKLVIVPSLRRATTDIETLTRMASRRGENDSTTASKGAHCCKQHRGNIRSLFSTTSFKCSKIHTNSIAKIYDTLLYHTYPFNWISIISSVIIHMIT